MRVCSAARAAASAAAPSASSDDDAVTCEDAMERIAWRQPAVKDSSSVVTGALSLRRRARAAAVWPRSAAAALARTSWVAVSQAHASWMTRRGDPDRSTGPDVRLPAPVIVALSSPNVVSDALHLVRYVSRTASAGAASWSRRGVITVQVSETSSFPPPGRTALCSAARTGSRSSFFPDGAFSQVSRDPSGSQPRSSPSNGRLMPSFTRATTCPPASRIAVIRS